MGDFDFTEDQIERYSRHLLLPHVGGAGQKKLLASSVFMVGAGGLGSGALPYLAAAGVGRIGIADDECVERSNLHRQVLYRTGDIGRGKALTSAQTLRELNPDCALDLVPERLTAGNIRRAIHGYDVVLDGSDNFPTRFLVADCCRFEGIPLVSAAVIQFDGQLMTILPGKGNPCYRCFVPGPPPPEFMPTCRDAGVLGPVVGVMGALQAVEAIKVLLGLENILSHTLLVYDALRNQFLSLNRHPDPECPMCGVHPSITELMDTAEQTCERE